MPLVMIMIKVRTFTYRTRMTHNQISTIIMNKGVHIMGKGRGWSRHPRYLELLKFNDICFNFKQKTVGIGRTILKLLVGW